MSEEDALLSRLRWRSRRGMRELDQLFARYLDQAWHDAGADERATFMRLLDCEDPSLWPWLMGREHPEDGELDALIQKIRALPAN